MSCRFIHRCVNCFSVCLTLAALYCSPGAARVACGDEPLTRQADVAVRLTNPRTERWQMGVRVQATGITTGILATLPVPRVWPEQDVKIIDREQTRQVRTVRLRDLDDGVQQMSVAIPRLAAGDEATALVTMEIVKRDIVAPEDPESLVVPKRVARDMTRYLRPSPYINSEDRVIAASARQVVAGKEGGWEQAEAIYDWVREKIEYRFDRNIKSARQALDDGYGDCEEMTSLFIAMCRAVRIPARAVWVPGHCYPEFYLEDPQGKGQWYPCQAAGTHSFGAMSESRPILQKGDNFRVPGHRQPLRYVQETLAARNAAAPPQVEFIRKKLQ